MTGRPLISVVSHSRSTSNKGGPRCRFHCSYWSWFRLASRLSVLLFAQWTPDVYPILVYCWANVVDVVPTLHQHYINISCFPIPICPTINVWWITWTGSIGCQVCSANPKYNFQTVTALWLCEAVLERHFCHIPSKKTGRKEKVIYRYLAWNVNLIGGSPVSNLILTL